jgi:hypothetical protein
MSANGSDTDDIDRTLRLMKELAAVRERLADTQRRVSRPRIVATISDAPPPPNRREDPCPERPRDPSTRAR